MDNKRYLCGKRYWESPKMPYGAGEPKKHLVTVQKI